MVGFKSLKNDSDIKDPNNYGGKCNSKNAAIKKVFDASSEDLFSVRLLLVLDFLYYKAR
jgi:hypothetical protein